MHWLWSHHSDICSMRSAIDRRSATRRSRRVASSPDDSVEEAVSLLINLLKHCQVRTTCGAVLFFLMTTTLSASDGVLCLHCSMADHTLTRSWFFASNEYGMTRRAALDSCMSSPPAPIDVDRMSSSLKDGNTLSRSETTSCWRRRPLALQDCGFMLHSRRHGTEEFETL